MKWFDTLIETGSEHNWGGQWTETKLEAFVEYVEAYLTILKRYPRYKTIYFDGFAGIGERILKKEKLLFLIDFDFPLPITEEIRLYQGSASRVLNLKSPFNYYYFIEKHPENVASLKKLISSTKILPGTKIEIREDDCNNQLKKLATALHSKPLAALIFLDPFGMQIDWSSIAELKGTRSDVWILIPSGVAINRLLDRKGEVNSIDKLERFFGLNKDSLIKIFYPEKALRTLFGEKIVYEKVNKPIEKIVDVYKNQLSTVWRYTSDALVLKNSKNVPIFHLIFASNNPTGLKIANFIIEKRKKQKKR